MSVSAVAPVLFTPRIAAANQTIAYWLRQANLRLRREMCWCWANRAGQVARVGLPPSADPAAENLDLTRYDHDKRRFFETDITARYLTEQIQTSRPIAADASVRGSWDWMAQELALDDAAQFVLALATAARLDSALGAVCSACLNDASRPYPTLALAQRLWDEPSAITAIADGAHALFRHGLLAWPVDAAPGLEWHQPLELQAWLAQTLLDPGSALPGALEEVPGAPQPLSAEQEMLLWRLAATPLDAAQIVPLLGAKDADYGQLAGTLTRHLGRRLARVRPTFEPERHALLALAAVAWLRGVDLLAPEHWAARHAHKGNESWFAPATVPVRWYLPIPEPGACHALPSFALTPICRLPELTFEQRLAQFRSGLGERANDIAADVGECARRYRFQHHAIERVAQTLGRSPTLSAAQLHAACRAEAAGEFGHLAQPVVPRFMLDELVLPSAQAQQIDEIRRAMNALTTVHYGWGTARAWNEGGLAVLFGGPPGTGKTMAAEALAHPSALGLPMYRIDLSQVVNKYIGETEKNLKRIFDAAELADCILFFDEADALFGKRTEVKDAHDRFANIEISYLLERMERFKGLAILATNRKKDLDEAFMRRLRYVVEFPLPGVAERERIWRAVFPQQVDVGGVDFRYLARQFPLAGGHIRSIAFNACLLSATRSGEAKVAMPTVLIAVKRELDKLNRAAAEELFGSYAPMLREVVA
jgi:ATPase family protein associated with various cellular activities (AAA)